MSNDCESELDPSTLCEHAWGSYRFDRTQHGGVVVEAIECRVCGAQQVARREPETIVENLTHLNYLLRKLAGTIADEFRGVGR